MDETETALGIALMKKIVIAEDEAGQLLSSPHLLFEALCHSFPVCEARRGFNQQAGVSSGVQSARESGEPVPIV